MLGDIRINFTYSGLDVFGNPETVTGAQVRRNGAAVASTTAMTNPTSGVVTVADIDLPVGTASGFELALVDNDNTVGLWAPFSVQVANAGPSAPTIGSVTFVPKQVPPSP